LRCDTHSLRSLPSGASGSLWLSSRGFQCPATGADRVSEWGGQIRSFDDTWRTSEGAIDAGGIETRRDPGPSETGVSVMSFIVCMQRGAGATDCTVDRAGPGPSVDAGQVEYGERG
jgi:hypothetical protein